MQINLLGGFEVVVDGRRVPPTHWRRRRAAALVKLLALAPRRVLHREQVIDTLWPHLCIREAAPRLYKAAHYARRALARPQSLVLSDESVALFPDAEVAVDAVRFEQLAGSARDSRTAGKAADAYPGDLLPQDLYEAWTDEPRERLRMLYLRVLRRAGRWQDIVNIDPTDESAHLELIRGPAGETRSAVHQFEWLERGLRRELIVAPSPEAVHLRDELAHSVRRGQGQIIILGGPAAGPGQPMVRREGNSPYWRVVEAIAELCRDHPTPPTATPIAVVIM